jgi:hypothetical protein
MGSIFASQTSATIAIPFDSPNSVTIRRLTGRECDAAAEAHRQGAASVSPRAWPAVFRRLLEKGASDPEVLKAIHDPLTGYDRFALVRAGLVAWSYPQWVVLRADAVNREADLAKRTASIDDLDDEAVDFIATEVLRLTKPWLFLVTEAAADDAKKKD